MTGAYSYIIKTPWVIQPDKGVFQLIAAAIKSNNDGVLPLKAWHFKCQRRQK
jgi:hypothetical protein